MVQTNAFQKIFIQLLDSNQFLRLSYKENNEVHETSKSSFYSIVWIVFAVSSSDKKCPP